MKAYLPAFAGLFLVVTGANANADCGSMQRLAQQHSNSMAQRNSMDHAGFEERARKGAKAENVAYGAKTKPEAMAMWAASPSHASNMMLPGCKAVASARSRAGLRYWTMEIAKTMHVR